MKRIIVILTTLILFASLAPSPVSAEDSDITEINYISITSDSDFRAHPAVSGGRGTERSPWIIENLKVENEYLGIVIMDTRDHFVIRNCEVSGASGNPTLGGILLRNVINGKVQGNFIHSNTYGIIVRESSHTVIEDNIIGENTQYGIYSDESNNILMKRNLITDNDWGCIKLSYSIQNTVSMCSLSDSYYGIFVSGSEDLRAMGNTVSGNECGMFVRESLGCEIFGNDILNNTNGVHLERSLDNTLYNSNFLGNTQHAFDDGQNQWHNTQLNSGNYWDDYTGTSPYPIPGGSNSDEYPSIEPFEIYSEVPASNWPIAGTIVIVAVAILAIASSVIYLVRKARRKKLTGHESGRNATKEEEHDP